MQFTTHQLLNAIQQDMAPMGLQKAPEAIRDRYYSISGIIKKAVDFISVNDKEYTREEKLNIVLDYVSYKTEVPKIRIVGNRRNREFAQAR